jgi:CRP/FNR family transcriptional regulator, cyclic AMP receptor protein
MLGAVCATTTIECVMPQLADRTTFERSLSALPLVTYQVGETVIADGSRTGRLLILRKGAVAIVKGDTEIAKVQEPGAVFGELSVLLDQPHTADVIALEASQFHVAEAASLLADNPIAVLYVATVLAHRLDGANHALIQLKGQSAKKGGKDARSRRKRYLSGGCIIFPPFFRTCQGDRPIGILISTQSCSRSRFSGVEHDSVADRTNCHLGFALWCGGRTALGPRCRTM